MIRKKLIIHENVNYEKIFFKTYQVDTNIWIITSNINDTLCIYNYDILKNDIVFFQKISTYTAQAMIVKNDDLIFLLYTDHLNLVICGLIDKFHRLDYIRETSIIHKFETFFVNNLPTYVIKSDKGIKIYDSKNVHIDYILRENLTDHLLKENTINYTAIQKDNRIYIYQCNNNSIDVYCYNNKIVTKQSVQLSFDGSLFLLKYDNIPYIVVYNTNVINIFEINDIELHCIAKITVQTIYFKKIESITITDFITITTDTFVISVKNENVVVNKKPDESNDEFTVIVNEKKYMFKKYTNNNTTCDGLFGHGEIVNITERKYALEKRIDLFLNVNVTGNLQNSSFIKSQKKLLESFQNVINNYKNKIIESYVLEKGISESFDSFFVKPYYSEWNMEISSENETVQENNYINLDEYDGSIIIIGYISQNEPKNIFPHTKKTSRDELIIRYNGTNYTSIFEGKKCNIDENDIKFEIIFTLKNMDTISVNPIECNMESQFIAVTKENDEYVFINSVNNNINMRKKINNTFVSFLLNTVTIKYNMLFDFNDTEFNIEPMTLLSHKILKNGTNTSKEFILNDINYNDYDIIKCVYD